MGAITLIAAVVLYGLCFYMSYKAADIFNQVVAERQLFPGTVTVERLTATSGVPPCPWRRIGMIKPPVQLGVSKIS